MNDEVVERNLETDPQGELCGELDGRQRLDSEIDERNVCTDVLGGIQPEDLGGRSPDEVEQLALDGSLIARRARADVGLLVG